VGLTVKFDVELGR